MKATKCCNVNVEVTFKRETFSTRKINTFFRKSQRLKQFPQKFKYSKECYLPSELQFQSQNVSPMWEFQQQLNLLGDLGLPKSFEVPFCFVFRCLDIISPLMPCAVLYMQAIAHNSISGLETRRGSDPFDTGAPGQEVLKCAAT